MREIKGWMSEMPIEQTAGVDDNEALREKIGDITLDSDQVQNYLKYYCIFKSRVTFFEIRFEINILVTL